VQKESLADLAKGRHDTQLRPPGESGEREIPGGHIRGNTLRVGVGNLPGMSEPSLSSITIYQLRVVLCGVSPLVWRRWAAIRIRVKNTQIDDSMIRPYVMARTLGRLLWFG
jgi:hypothetical protein